MTPLSDDPRLVNMRAGIVTCMAMVSSAVGDGTMASAMLAAYSRPVIDQIDADSVMLSQGVEGSVEQICDGWRLAILQLARMVDKDGDFMLKPGRMNPTWSTFCVDALHHTQQPLQQPLSAQHSISGLDVSITTSEDRTGFGPLEYLSYSAMFDDAALGPHTVRFSLAVGKSREEAIARLAEAAELALQRGESVDMPYAHVTLT